MFQDLRTSVKFMSQACCHCECQSFGVLCSSLARQDRTAVIFTFPNELPSTVASSVSSLAYPSHVPDNFLPNRVQSSASNQLASSISSFAFPELPMLLLHRSVSFPHDTRRSEAWLHQSYHSRTRTVTNEHRRHGVFGQLTRKPEHDTQSV